MHALPSPPRAIILLSGGMDSATCLAIARHQGWDCYALSIHYGQRHAIELDVAKKIAATAAVVAHKIIHLSWNFGGSSLTDKNLAVPPHTHSTPTQSTIPNTYVPARNTLFLSIALGWAEVLGAHAIFIGANAVDYSGYPDCRPAFIDAFNALAQVATCQGLNEHGPRIYAPLLHLKKAQIIQKAHSLGIHLSQTISCYQPDAQGHACGICHSCTLRKQGFLEAGIADPTHYQSVNTHRD